MDGTKLNIKLDENVPCASFDKNLNLQSDMRNSTAVQQVLEHSVVTRGEIEDFSQLLLIKDNHIKNVEEKLSELEIKVSVYNEKFNNDQLKNKYKEDLIESLKLSIDLLNANNEQYIKSKSMKGQMDNWMAQQNISDELEKVLKDFREKVECMEQELIRKNSALKNKESELKEFQTINRKLKNNNSKLSSKLRNMNNHLEKSSDHHLYLESKIESLTNELIQKNTLLDIKSQFNSKEHKRAYYMNQKLNKEINKKNNELKEYREEILRLTNKTMDLERDIKY